MKPNLPPHEIPPKVPDSEMDKLKRQIWELQQQLKAYGKSADWSDQVDLVFKRQIKIWKKQESLSKRMGILESAMIFLINPNMVNEILDKLKQEKAK